MTLDEFRSEMETWWAKALKEADKEPILAQLELKHLYQKFDSHERVLADLVLCEWVISDDNSKQFTALAMVDHFRIHRAKSQLFALEAIVLQRTDHEAPYVLAKIRRILVRLEQERTP